MILGFPRAKQGLCHTKHGGGGYHFVSIAHSISSFILMKVNRFDVGEEVKNMIGDIFNRAPETRPRLLSSTRIKMRPRSHSKSSVHGIVRRSRSIQVDPAQAKGKHVLLSTFLQTI